MKLTQWFSEQHECNNTIWAIVDVLQYPETKEAFDFTSHATPLLPSNIISNMSDICYAFQLTKDHIQWWDKYKHCGILVAGKSQVIEHFGSIFRAHMDREKVYFPFYNVPYIAPMLKKLTVTELDNWLGMATSCLIYTDNKFIEYYPQQERTLLQHDINNLWWEIKEHHLEADAITLDSLKVWLWRNNTSSMIKFSEKGLNFDDFSLLNISKANNLIEGLFDTAITIMEIKDSESFRAELKNDDLLTILSVVNKENNI